MFFACSGVGLLLVSYLLGIFRWRQFARSIPRQCLRDGFEANLDPVSRNAPDEDSPEVLYGEMIAAGRRLQEALDRGQRLRRHASKGLNQVSTAIEREARERVDRAAANYLQATQRFRASVQTIGIECKQPAYSSLVWSFRTLADWAHPRG
jgi:hypothetical protein